MQNRIFTIFQFIFVARTSAITVIDQSGLTLAAGVIAQTQPKFIANRDIFEAREKKAKLYSWWAFCFGEIVAEVPYLLVCALLYFAPWYVPVVRRHDRKLTLCSGTPSSDSASHLMWRARSTSR